MPENNALNNENRSLSLENERLRSEVGRLNAELKKLAREMRISGRFLEKVTRASEAKDTLSSALSDANAKQRAYTDMLLESCPSIIILFDNNGRIVLCTQALLAATDTPNFDYIKNRSYEEVLPRYFSSDSIEAFKTAVSKVTSTNEMVTFDALVDFTNSGQNRMYSIELRRAGTGILAVMVDLTDIMYEKERAEKASSAKSEFLAAMSYEIRSPMNTITGMSDMLARTELNVKQKKYVSDICQSSNALLMVINDILDFSKIEAGKMELVYVNHNLKTMLDNLYVKFNELCREKSLELEYYVAKSLPTVVCGDENRLRQILTNLLSNSMKYTRKGGLVFSAWMDEGNILHFDVKDSGVGIREDDLSKLFRPFEQLDSRKSKDMLGTGLGLAISYNLCKLMGGTLKLDSIYGQGSNFSVALPYIQSDQLIKKDISEIYDFKAPEAKILVVDDVDINLEVVEAMLGAFEIVPDLTFRGVHAVELAKKKQYDLIFMDHMMPEMDGLQATKCIRELGGWNERVPIIALTANAIDGMDTIFLNGRMNDYLFKPISISSLNLCLKKWLPPELVTSEDRRYA